ncbi:MAG: hypothetical protein J6W05_11405 [Prevotella sp.]|nr:hypothetical protein [Prevotella sp.]
MKQVFKHFLISTALLFASLGAFAGGDATVIYKLDGNASSADVVGIVTYSSSNGTITVTPKDGYYLEATDLTVYKMIDGQYAQGRTREPNYMTPVAVTATNSGADPSNTTTYTITVPGDEYDYEIVANFHVRKSVEDATVTGLADSYTYTGEPIKPVVTVKVGGNTLTLGTDYRAFYADSINASTDQVKGKITLYGIRKYTGTKQINYTIAKADPTLTFSSATATYTYGQAFTQPTLTTTPTGLAVKYTSSNTNVADVDQSTGAITAKAASTEAITITASFAGNDNYNAEEATYSLTVAKGSATLATPPAAIANLTYNGQNQALITAGSATNGTLKYSLTGGDATDFSETIPTGKEAKTYTIYYKVEGNDNYNGTESASLDVTIGVKTVSAPTIILSETSFEYDGTAKQPTVTVKDGDTEIQSTEYTVSYSNNTNVAASTDNKAPTVTITDKDGGNYTVSGSTTFSITAADGVVTPPTAIANLTYTGQNQALINAGSSTTGTVKYSLTGADATDYSETVPTGKDAKTYIIYYKVEGDANHKDVAPTSINVTIAAKTVSEPTITLSQTSFVYDGTAKQPTVTVKDVDTEIPSTEYTVSYTNNTDAAAATDTKAPTVTITDKDGGNYTVSGSTTFTILAADGSLTLPTAIEGLTYNGQNQALITAGSSATGTMKYSLTAAEATDYSEDIPTGKDAKTYTVYYKVEGDANHNDIAPASLEVTIAAKTVSAPTITLSQTSFVYDGTAKQPTVTVKDGDTEIPATEYTVSYTNNTDVAASTDNKAPTVTITDKDGGNYTVSGSATFTITAKETTPTVTLATTSYVYDGTAKEPAVTVTIPGEGENADPVTLTSNDYTVAYSDNTNAGTNTAKATVTLKGNYSGSGSATFTIGQATIDAVTLSATQLIYSGSDQTVTVTKVMAGTLEVASDFYTVSGNTGKEPGTYTVTVKAKTDIANNFKGEVTAQFAIINRTATEEELGIAAGQTYGTYINLTEDLLMPETVVAYIITDCDGKTVTATEIGYIPKDVPVLLEKKNATTRPEGVPQTDGNMLKYAANNTSVDRSEGTVYLLYNGQFVRATNNSVSAKHIYLQLAANTGNGARALGIRHGDESTGIGAVFNDERIMNNDKWYDLQGQRIEKPTKKGLYIHQGKKVVIK